MNNIKYLTFIPDFGEKMTSKESQPFIKILHNLKDLTYIDVGIYIIDDNLINLLYNKLEKLKSLKKVKITVELILENDRKLFIEKMNKLKKEKDLLDLKIIYKEKRSP